MGFSTGDRRWQRYNKKLKKLMKANDFFGLGTTYYEMAAFLEKEGGDPKIYREQGYKMKVQSMKDSFNNWIESGVVNGLEVLATDDSCTFCTENNQKIQTIHEAKTKSLIPNEKCAHKYGCRCVYLPVLEGEI